MTARPSSDPVTCPRCLRAEGFILPDVSERALALMAQSYAAWLLPVGTVVILSNLGPDKFGGRYDADVRTKDGRQLAALIIGAGLARPYAGGKRGRLCAQVGGGA